MSIFDRDIELHEFSRGTEYWRYADNDRDVTVDGVVYSKQTFKSPRVTQSAEQGKAKVDLEVSLNLPVLALWRPQPPMDRIGYRLRRFHKATNTIDTIWMGAVSDFEETTNTGKITCVSAMSTLASNGLNRVWQVPCPLLVYGVGRDQCNADKNAMKVTATLDHNNGVIIGSPIFAGKPNGWFDGGWIEFQMGLHTERRFILTHIADELRLMTTLPGGSGLITLDALPGCDHTKLTCHEKFDNAVNYGGQDTIPKTNPFGQAPVF